MKLYYWEVFSVNGGIADGVVFANSKEEALEKVETKYNNEYLKVELDKNSGIAIEEEKDISGLYVRWED